MNTRSFLRYLLATSVFLGVPVSAQIKETAPPASRILQYEFNRSNDPRLVIMLRSGAGPARPAETTIFEVVNKGDRLRKLYTFILRNSKRPLQHIVLGGGRFIVTIDEWEGIGKTDNCIVMYDAVGPKVTAKRLESFLPEAIRSRLERHAFLPGVRWNGGIPSVDYENLVVYPSTATACTEKGLPFLSIDVRSQTVEVQPIPKTMAPTAIEYGRAMGLACDWSNGNDPEPDWQAKLAYPLFLKASVDPARADKHFLAYVNFTGDAFFQLEAQTGDYIRCAGEKWTERKAKSGGGLGRP